MRGFFSRFWPALAFLAVIMTPALAGAGSVNVVIPPESAVAGERVLLGDIAYIEADGPGGEGLAAQLKNIDLGPAPAMGQELVLRQTQVERHIMDSKLNVGEARWSIPPELRLTREAQAMDQDKLKQIILDHLSGSEPYRSGQYDLASFNTGPLPSLPPGQATYRFVPQGGSNPAYLSGTIFFAVDGKEVARTRVTAQVDLSINALVATRSMSRGHIIDDTDLSLTLAPYAQAKGALTDPDVAVGSALKVAVNAGEVIKDRHLTKSVMVRRGDRVSLVAQSGPLKVTAAGEARQDGALGDTISVMNLDSKKTISGRVIGPNQVEVIF